MNRIKKYKRIHYSYTRNKTYIEPAWRQDYELTTTDNFIIGIGYSLHRTKTAASNYDDSAVYWWAKANKSAASCVSIEKRNGPVKVFVSSRTLEQIVKSEDKCIFVELWKNY